MKNKSIKNISSSNKSKSFTNNFNQKKENTICSLYEVENFLCNFKNFTKYIKLYNILK